MKEVLLIIGFTFYILTLGFGICCWGFIFVKAGEKIIEELK